jgi:leucyl aminopeptidase
MEWSPLSHIAIEVVGEGMSNDNDASPLSKILNDADLLIVGITAPSKDKVEEEVGDDEEESEETKEESPLELQGISKQIDNESDGILTEILTETMKSFKNGKKLGTITPMVRTTTGSSSATASSETSSSTTVTKRYALLGLGSVVKPKSNNETETGEASSSSSSGTWNVGTGATLGKALAQMIATSLHQNNKIRTIHVVLPHSMTSNTTIVRDMVTSFYSELHVDNRYRTGDRVKKIAEHIQTIQLFSDGIDMDGTNHNSADIATAIEEGRQLATGIILTKDIVNAPHNVLNSESLAETAKRIAKDTKSNGRIKCTILNKKECEARNMGAYLGVARGSETEPQFIQLTYTPSGPIHKKIAVIGKGLLFDTGGYNIKTQMMEMMKFDCGGAAAVLGAARAIGSLQPPGVEVHFIVAACENMINDKAMVPSDILTASNGKTIEVLNTDAEGRLTLADALVYADKELGCESIIELSTLTGACMVALGKSVSGVWTDNDALATELADISKVTGDKLWRMPLEKEYNEQLESKFADLKNIGGKYGGSITAALFLQNFVSKKKPFAHIDIAGPVWSEKNGATGYGTKLIVEWVTRQGISKE